MAISRRAFLGAAAVGSSVAIAEECARAQSGSSSPERQWRPNWVNGQPEHHPTANAPIALQPLADQVRQIESAWAYLGQPFAASDRDRINTVLAGSDEAAAVVELQKVLTRYVLVNVTINPESRVSAVRAAALAELVQDGTRLFLVKVLNQAGATATLHVESPNSQPVYVSAWKDESPRPEEHITPEQVRERWADISLYQQPPLTNQLSGLALEYAVLEIYSRDAGPRSGTLSFNIGPGTEDLAPQNTVHILFRAKAAHAMLLGVRDDGGGPTMASFIFRDQWDVLYPNQSKRLAPDFFFQPQVYRADGESIRLPEGAYEVTCTGGAEYVSEVRQVQVYGGGPRRMTFQLKRWIHPAKQGWYSGDHHLHAAGCSHYVTPTEGVGPNVMMRQVEGEHLNVGCVLNWAPCYYHQRQFFTGHDNPLSKPDTILHYDLEISGFPSSHCGHLVLLGLREQNYPGAKRIEDWPTWNLPVLQWAKEQGAVVGYPHSGWGLAVSSRELPNYEIPPFDGIGANEYIVDVTHPNAVDFISAGDTPYIWELNIWYHTLNAGFRTRLSGETDFPCITDSRVGQGRVYAMVDGPLTYRRWLKALQAGASYMSDGKGHLMNFAANGVTVGSQGSELQMAHAGNVHVTVQAAAYLEATAPAGIRQLPYDKKPYWDIERARVTGTRAVAVELVWNGECVARANLVADGKPQSLSFDFAVKESGWMALRILPSCHTNPIFVTVGAKPMRPVQKSVKWCLAAVDQCWSQKANQIAPDEMAAAKKAYEHAREAYRQLAEHAG